MSIALFSSSTSALLVRSTALAALALLAAGCPAPGEGVRFADATDAQLAEAVLVASGMPVTWAARAQLEAEVDAVGGCPAREVLATEPLDVRYAADACTTPAGAVYDGTAEVRNPLGWAADGQTAPGETHAVLDAFTALGATFDGTWSRTDARPGHDHVAEADLVVAHGDHTWAVTGTWSIRHRDDRAPHTTCGAANGGHVEGLGAFTASCDMTAFGQAGGEGWLELHGADTVRVSVTPDADGCLPATVGGVARAPICLADFGDPGEPEPVEIPEEVVLDVAFVADFETIAVEVEMVSAVVARAEVVLATDRLAAEVHPLARTAVGGTSDTWGVQLETIGRYDAGERTRLSLDDLTRMYTVLFAYGRDGAVLACHIVGSDDDHGPIDISACPR